MKSDKSSTEFGKTNVFIFSYSSLKIVIVLVARSYNIFEEKIFSSSPSSISFIFSPVSIFNTTALLSSVLNTTTLSSYL